MFKKIFLGYLSVLLVSFIVLALAFSFTLRQYLINDTIASLHRVAETLSGSASRQGMHGGGHMRVAFFGLANRIAYADYIILQEDGMVIDSSDQNLYPPGTLAGNDAYLNIAFEDEQSYISGEVVAVAYPITTDSKSSRAALILYTEPGLLNQLNRALSGILFLALAVGIAFSIVAGVLATRVVVKPLNQLKTRALEMAARRFEGKLEISTGDELEELAEAFNEMGERLSAYDHAQKDFFQKASHELKTPLMSIQGYAEAVKDGVIPPDEVEQSLEIIIRESERMKALVDQFIYISKMETLGDNFAPRKIDLRKAAEEATEAVRSLAIEKGLTIKILAPGPVNPVNADPEKIHRLFLNTLGNAIRHSCSTVTITIQDRQVLIDDDGPGFKQGDEEKVFDPFYSGASEGSGLGLAISRAIAERHGGTISAENRPEGGARIIIKLPS
jgi:signal transduction histidine kinase